MIKQAVVTEVKEGQMIEFSTGEMFLRVGSEWYGIKGGYWKLLLFDHNLEMAYQLYQQKDLATDTLTLEKLQSAEPHSIVARGEIFTDMSANIPAFRWVAKRGLIDDWAMYFGASNKDWKWIAEMGEKMRDEAAIRKECTDEVFIKYRW